MGVGIVGIVIWDQEVYGKGRLLKMVIFLWKIVISPESTRTWWRNMLDMVCIWFWQPLSRAPGGGCGTGYLRFEDPGPAKQQTSTNAAQIENCHDVGLKNAMLWKAHVPMYRKCLKSVWKVQPENHSWCRIKSVPTHPNADVFVLVVRKNLLGLSAKRKKEGQRLWQ